MRRSLPLVLGLVTLLTTAGPGLARDAGQPGSRGSAPSPEARDLFEAESAGDVQIRFIANDSRSAQVILKNTTGKPLTLKMPAAFAGVPVLAQMGMGGMGMGGGMGGMGGGMGGGQAMGGGFGNQGMNGIGGGMGGGMGGPGMGGMGGMGMPPGGAFSIPPERTKVVRVTTVCLEHGKKEPSSRMAYKLVPLEDFSTDPTLRAVVEGLGRGEMTQKVAQAATWHVANGLTWEQLAAKRIDRLARPDDPWFTPVELAAAHRSVAVAAERAAATAAAGTAVPSASRDTAR